MSANRRSPFKKAVAVIALSLISSSETSALEQIRRQFLNKGNIVNVSAARIDEKHVAVSAIQITSDRYREFRVLNPKDGSSEIWEFSNDTLRVTYTLPYRGKFLKMQIQKREDEGLRNADFILSEDGSRYVLVRQNFRKYKVFHAKRDASSKPDCDKTLSAAALDEKNKVTIRAAFDAITETAHKVATSALDSSCKTSAFENDKNVIEDGLAQVIATRDPGASDEKYLSCLNRLGLKGYSARLETYFSESLEPAHPKSVFCEVGDNGDRGEYHESKKRTTLFKPLDMSGTTESGLIAYYADTFFHESLHRAGLEDEKLVHDIVSCCGMEKGSGTPSSCASVTKSVADMNNRNARLIASKENLKGFSDIWIKVEKATDEQRVNTFFDNYIDMLKARRSRGEFSYDGCLREGKKSDNECLQAFLVAADVTIRDYFLKECPMLFRDKKPQDRNALCQSLSADTTALVHKNSTEVCNPNETNQFRRSCFYAAREEKERLIKKAGDDGLVIEEPEFYEDAQAEMTSKNYRDAYLSAFADHVPGVEPLFNRLKDTIEPQRAKDMFFALIKSMGGTAEKVQANYDSCVKEGNDKASCAEHGKITILTNLYRFFGRTCRTYYTTEENRKAPCEEIAREAGKVLNASFAKGCKTSSDLKRIGVPENDLTCVLDAIANGKKYALNIDELKKAGKYKDSDAQPMVRDSEQAQKKAARDVASVPRQTPISRSGAVYAFNPNDDQFDRQLKEDLGNTPSPANEILSKAGRVISDLAIPSAHAQSHDSSFNDRAPAAISGQSAVAGAVQTTSSINTDLEKSGQALAAALSSREVEAPRIPFPQEGSASPRSNADDSGGASKAAASSSTSQHGGKSGGSATGKAKKQSPASGSSAGRSGSAEGGVGGTAESLRDRRMRILDLFKKEPQEALARLNQGDLTEELTSSDIEAKDAKGKLHGSRNPVIRIWYDAASRTFLGIPDP